MNNAHIIDRTQAGTPWNLAEDRRPLLARGPKVGPGRRYARRANRGERAPGSKLTAKDVQVIRELWALGVSQRTIAKAYHIAQPTVSGIVRREKWVHVPATEAERVALSAVLETDAQPIMTTGRIQHLTGSGTWDTFPDIRRAEIATGEDRQDIATACLSAGTGWRYEPGTPTEPTPDLW